MNGIYLVIDPAMERVQLLDKTREALEGGVAFIQLWNHWPDDFTRGDKEELAEQVLVLANRGDTPVLVNEEWELLKNSGLHGVHFDSIPDNFSQVRREIGREFICGITCSNNLEVVEWADEHRLDYISFCAMFPSPSVESCPIVRPDTVKKARKITNLPLFLSGGLTPENLDTLSDLDYDGIAVISGIMNSDSPRDAVTSFQEVLTKSVKKS